MCNKQPVLLVLVSRGNRRPQGCYFELCKSRNQMMLIDFSIPREPVYCYISIAASESGCLLNTNLRVLHHKPEICVYLHS